jgi:uncharacterized protein (DUF2235 family)
MASNARHRDTVASVGIVPRTLPFTASDTCIRHFRHAISLDERRTKFKANHYHLRLPEEQKGLKPGEMPLSNHHNKHHDHSPKDEVSKHDDGPDVLEVWFAGCHCGNSPCLNVICLVPTSFCRHWWGSRQEWREEQLGKNTTSLDDSPMLSC